VFRSPTLLKGDASYPHTVRGWAGIGAALSDFFDPYTHTHTHTYIHTYIYTYIHSHMHIQRETERGKERQRGRGRGRERERETERERDASVKLLSEDGHFSMHCQRRTSCSCSPIECFMICCLWVCGRTLPELQGVHPFTDDHFVQYGGQILPFRGGGGG
jgi:hypothetical protein